MKSVASNSRIASMKHAIVAAALLVLVRDAASQCQTRATETLPSFQPEQILKNMPVYHDRRCVGVVLVAAALLEGQPIADEECDVPGELGKRIYDAAVTRERVRFHRELCIGEKRIATESPSALDALSTAVADQYKSHYDAMKATIEGRAKLWRADSEVIKRVDELYQLLDADRDHIVAFPATGKRMFPDGRIQDTSHAILIAKKPAETIVVYDPNDPGKPIPCQLNETAEGLLIDWTCGYKDKGSTARQVCRLLHSEKAFRLILGRD